MTGFKRPTQLLRSSSTRRNARKVLNSLLILSLMLSILPISIASAAPNSPSAPFGVNADCTEVAAASQIFLPLVSGGSGGSSAANISASSSDVQTAPNARTLNYAVGKTYQYNWAVDVTNKSEGRDSEGEFTNTSNQNTVIRGIANITIQSKDEAGVASGQVTIDEPFVCSTDGEDASVLSGEDYDTLAADLQKPLLFKQASNGVISEVSVPEGSSTLALNMQKGIVNALQLTLQTEDSYAAEEQGAQGTYTVGYALTEEADGTHVTKTYNDQSFSNLISAGDPTSELEQSNTINLVIDDNGIIQSVSSVEEMQSSDESGTPPSTEDAEFDGATAWTNTTSTGSLTLKSVIDAPSTLMAASLNSVYRIDSLGAELSDDIGNEAGVDLDTVDLAAEFAALEADPTNPELVLRIVQLVRADDSTDNAVLTQLQDRLAANSSDTDIVNAYIDVLTQVGTPAAQEIIVALIPNSGMAQAAGINATLTVTSEEHALINTVLFESPTITTVEAISQVVASAAAIRAAGGGADDNHDTAVGVLSTLADNINNEAIADDISEQMLRSLSAASDDETKTLYLEAIGNTGDPEALGTLSDYVQNTGGISESLDVQLTAMVALRKFPEAEGLLIDALSSTNEEVEQNEDLFALRDVAFAILSDRDSLSNEAVAALEIHNTAVASLPSGYYTYNWNRHLGGSTVGVNLPGHMGVATPPKYYPYLYVRQEAKAHIWSYTRSLIYGSLLAKQTSSQFQFKAYLNIGGGLIRREVNYTLPTVYNSGTRTLYSVNKTVFNVTVKVPIFWAISVNFNIKGTGYFRLTWYYRHNVSSFSSGFVQGNITPTVWASASASAYLDIVVARGGGTLTADLLKTSIPATGTVNYASGSLSFCLNITAQTQALSGRFYVWGDLRVPRFGIPPWKWKRIVTATLWTFSTPTRNYTLYNRCV